MNNKLISGEEGLTVALWRAYPGEAITESEQTGLHRAGRCVSPNRSDRYPG